MIPTKRQEVRAFLDPADVREIDAEIKRRGAGNRSEIVREIVRRHFDGVVA